MANSTKDESEELFLSNLKEHIEQLLDNLSDISAVINKKSSNMLSELETVTHSDIEVLERIGLRMFKMLNTCYLNVMDITNILEKDLDMVNLNRSDKLFKNLCSKILEYKQSRSDVKETISRGTQTAISDIPNEHLEPKQEEREGDEEIQAGPPVDNIKKCTKNDIDMVSQPGTSSDILNEHLEPKQENREGGEEVQAGPVDNIKKNIKINIDMGLARTDTQDTEDGWVDTINRLPSAIDLWTGNYDRSMFPNKEEFLTSSTEDQIEENKWERETEDLNYEQCKDDLPDDLLSDEDTVIEPRKSAEEHASAEINNTSHSTSSILLDETKGQSNSADTEIVTKGHDENCVPDSLLESPSSTTDDPNAANDATDKSINTEQSVLHSDDSNSRHSNKETMTEEEPPELCKTGKNNSSDIPDRVESAKQAPIAEQSQNSETINDGSITSTVPNQQDDINISHISTSTVVIASTGPLETKSDDDCNADPTLLNVNKWVEESEFQNMPSDSDDNRADAGSTLVATSKTIDGVNEHNTDTPSSSQEPDEADPNNEHISETATACSEGVIRTYSQETLLLNLNSQEIIDSGSSHTVDSVNEFQLHHSPDSSSKSVNISTAIEDTVPEESDIDKIEAPSKDTEHLENSLSKTDLQTIEKKTANNALLDYSNSPDLFESVPISEESIINNVTNEEIVEQPLQNVNNSNENILLNIRDDNAISSAQNKSLSSEDERMLLSPVSETDTILASMPSPSNNEKDAEVTTSEVVAPTDGGLVDSTTADVNKNQDECSKTDVADTTTVTSSEETSQETVILKGDKIENNAVLPDVPCTDCSESRTKEFIPAPNVTPETVSEKNIPSEEEDTLTQNTISLVGNDDGKAKSNTSDTDDTVFNEDATLVENEPASIVTDNTESCSERSVEKETGSKEETRLSQDSATSFVFDISDNQNDIGSKSQTDNENCSSTNLRDESVKIDPAEEPINNCSDVDEDDDDDGVHLDVTMEEIICNGSPSYIENYGCQEENVVIKQEDEEIIEETPQNENSAAEGITSDPQQNVGDELLQLLREVEVPFDETVNSSSQSNKPKSNSKQESKEADEILKMLDEETVSDISDSDLSDDNLSLSGFDMDLLEDKLVKEVVDKKFEKSSDYDEKILSAFSIRDCYVNIPKIELDDDEIVEAKNSLSDSIERLCDLSSLLTKRKHGDQQEKHKIKKIKKSVKKTKGTSGTDSSSDYSHSDSDNPPHDNANTLPSYAQLDQKLDDFLANEICKVLKSNSSNESTDIDSDESDVKEKNDRDGKSICNNVEKKKQILSTEERLKKAWKNDPLLRGKLSSNDSSSTSSSASASDSEKSHKKRQALRTKYEHETDLNVISDDSDSDDDALNRAKLNKAQLEAKLISPIKRNIPKLDDSSDSDSDVEIIVLKSATPEKVANGDDHEFPGSSQKGRRNIRALMSDESLAEATQRANKEEQERIERLEGRHRVKESLSQSFTQSFEEDTMVLDMDDLTGEPLITVHPKLIRRLKPHQKSGIQFMWDSCYESVERLKVDDGSGCILAHCMGLGKTLQVITLLHTLFAYNQTNTKHVLVVCPLSTVNNWKKEVKLAFKRFPEGKLNVLTIADKKEVSQKYDLVKKWRMQKKSVLVLGYEGFETLTNENKLDKIGEHLKKRILEALIDPGPDLVVCDEGHLLRNKKALKTLALNRIKTKRRIVLTGTPLQNNLLEYYYMVDFVKPNLLGNMKEYKTNFVNPITNGQYEDSTAEDIKLMMKRTHVLHKLLKKTIQRVEDTELKAYLPKIVDHAVFIQLHQVQVNLYNKFSELVMKNSRNTNKGGFLSDFSVFQYICTHPHLLAVMENLRNKRIKERDLITNEQEDNLICNIEGWWKAVTPADAAEKIEYGNKLMVLKSIIEQCEEIGDKVLVFSQSLGEMDLIEHFLIKVGTAKCRSWQKKIDYARMDGTVPPVLRSTICDLFNDKDNSKLRLLLMSTKVGGLGLNLTAANRVIIMTVNWNPSYDIQSVFRVYRFGQEKRVYVYRLVALDSMEEKVYQRTVTKLAIAHRVVDKHQITRHYKSMDLQELYSCRPNADIERPISNVPEDKVLAKLILKLPYIYKYHEHQALLENRPEDNLNEHELNAAWDEFKRIKDAPPPVPPMPHAQQTVAHIPNNGPSFAMAYNLSRSKVAVVNDKKNGEVGKLADEILQYFTPAANNLAMNDLKKNPYSVASSLKPVRKGAVIDKQTIPAPATTNSAVERDPLFIPLSADTNNKTNKSYGELLTTFSQKHPSAIPKLPSGTTIMLEAPRSKPSQKENQQHKKPGIFKRPTNESIVILDDDSSKTKNHRSLSQPNPPVGIKRKRNIEGERQAILKRMREGFNKITNQLAPINIDDDDDISEVTDTVSETGSLSNELITNLGRSGITIHKVLRDAKSNNEVITLD